MVMLIGRKELRLNDDLKTEKKRSDRQCFFQSSMMFRVSLRWSWRSALSAKRNSRDCYDYSNVTCSLESVLELKVFRASDKLPVRHLSAANVAECTLLIWIVVQLIPNCNAANQTTSIRYLVSVFLDIVGSPLSTSPLCDLCAELQALFIILRSLFLSRKNLRRQNSSLSPPNSRFPNQRG